MVKAVVESGIAATAISELMVRKELQFGVLKALQIRVGRKSARADGKGRTAANVMQRSFTLLKHRERFQTRIAQTFEQRLTSSLKIDK